MVELPPLAYQNINGRKVEVACQFKLKKNRLTYHFPSGYNPDYELVIDPTLVFSTYTGSSSDNWGFTATYDDDGNAYAGGIIYSSAFNNGYPTITGISTTFFREEQPMLPFQSLIQVVQICFFQPIWEERWMNSRIV
ncbi:MAG: hypothetical protein R3B93_13510 [Bacteroidia bacterium]